MNPSSLSLRANFVVAMRPAGGLRHAVSDHVHHAEGEGARGVRCAGANDDDLLCVRRAEEREERCDAVDRAQTINLILCDEAIA